MKFCKKHIKTPLVGYDPCPSCEIERLRKEVAQLKREVKQLKAGEQEKVKRIKHIAY